jgi:hypothetical protein
MKESSSNGSHGKGATTVIYNAPGAAHNNQFLNQIAHY